MKKCQQCNATISDDAKFCHLCGAKIYEETTCPSCGQQLSPNDSFCHSCGAKIGAAQENVISHGVNQTHKPTSNVDSNNNSQQKLIIVIAILSIVGIAAYFIFGHEDKNATSNENDNMTTDTIQWDYVCSDTIANDTATFYDVEVDDTLQIIEVLKTVKGEYLPYDSSDSTDNDPGFFSNIYEKGAILLSSGSDGWECFMEQVDDKKSKFTVCGTGENYSYIIPNNSYKLKEYKKGKIPTFVLDNRCLIFKSKDGESLTLFKINRNGYSINWCEKEREVDINDENYQYGYNRYDKNEGYKRSGFCDVKNGYLTFDIYVTNREVIECFDKYGNMFCDTETPDGLGFGWAYIPKLKTLVINEVFYVFDSMIPYDRNYTPKNTVSKSVQKTNSSSRINSSSSNTSSNSKYSQREQELLEENKRLCNEWTRYDNALTKAMNEFDYNYKHGYSVVQSFGDMQFCVNKLDEIADGLSRIDSRTGSIFKDKVKKYKDGLEYCKVHSGYYR